MADNRSAKSTSKQVAKPNTSKKSLTGDAGAKDNNKKMDRASEDRRKQSDRRTNTDRRATQERRDTAGSKAATTATKKPVVETAKAAAKPTVKATSKPMVKPTPERTTSKDASKGNDKGNQTKNHSQVAAVRADGADSDKKLKKTSKREPGSRKPGTEQTKAESSSKK